MFDLNSVAGKPTAVNSNRADTAQEVIRAFDTMLQASAVSNFLFLKFPQELLLLMSQFADI